MNKTRFGSLRILTECSYCGSPLVLNGPQKKVICNSCNKQIHFSEDVWNGIFTYFDQNIHTMMPGEQDSLTMLQDGYTFKISYSLTPPKCQKCQTQLPVDSSLDFSSSLRCPSCANEHRVISAPNWLQDHDKIKLIGSDIATTSQSPEILSSSSPISMNCPNCSGALKISTEQERVTNCQYCDSEFFIPDPVWKKLHPVKVAKNWYVRIQGKLQWQIEAEQEQIRENKRKQLFEEREKQELFNSKQQELLLEINNQKGKWKSKVFWGYFGALMGGIFLIGFPIIFIPSLSKIVGNQICDGKFVRSTSSNRDGGTSINFSCRKDGVSKSFDGKMFLFGPGIGILTLAIIWSSFIPSFILKNKKKVNALKKKLRTMQQNGPPSGN
ncbi:MAG: hypothetical protein ACQES9_10690 [Myxococcota bacterium]